MLVFSSSGCSRVVIAAAGGEFTEVLGFSRLYKVSGARGRAREVVPWARFCGAAGRVAAGSQEPGAHLGRCSSRFPYFESKSPLRDRRP